MSFTNIDLKSYVKLVGATLAILAIVYLGFEIAKSIDIVIDRIVTLRGIFITLTLSVVYGLSLFFVFAAWLILLGKETAASQLGFRRSLEIYSVFQIMKYVPTNVVHQVTRYATLKDAGVSHKNIIWSSTAELAMLLFTSVLISAFTVGPLLFSFVNEYISIRTLALLAALSAALLLVLMLLIISRKRSTIEASVIKKLLARSILSLPLYIIFFLITGYVLLVTIKFIAPGSTAPDLVTTLGGNALAWVAGFITPGAPGGVGIREVVLIETFKPLGLAQEIGVIAAMFRLISTIGDAVFFGIARMVLILSPAPQT